MVHPEDLNQMVEELWPEVTIRCVAVSPKHALARLDPESADYRPGKLISGPAQFGLADCAFWFLVSGVLERVEPMAVTSELSIRFLRPARGDELWARADLERAGRTQVVATVRVYTEDVDEPTAVAQGTYALPRTTSTT